MRIRPGRTRSLFVGIMMVVVTILGLVMMDGFSEIAGGRFGPFIVIWIVVGLVGAAMALYNAFSAEGLPLYEVDIDEEEEHSEQPTAYCPHCGKPVDAGDQFCRHCGNPLT